jgi:Flp pilus assembly protein TadG
MSICKRTAQKLKSFAAATGGNVGIMTALTVLPMFLAAGAAIDLARYNSTFAQVQAAIDSAALAAAAAPEGTSIAKRNQIGTDTFYLNMQGGNAGGVDVQPSFTLKDGIIKASVTGDMDTTLMKLGGISTMGINISAEVNTVSEKKAEIVLVLDYSGSMWDSVTGGPKHELMRKAATKLVTSLKSVNKDNVKVGLVPFSQYVYATLPASHVLGQNGGGNWSGCTQDRGAPYNTGNDVPGNDDASKWGQPLNTEHASYTCEGFKDRDLKIVPLTDDFDRVTGALDAMRPYG